MSKIFIADKPTLDAVKSVTDGIKTVVDGVKTTVDSVKTTADSALAGINSFNATWTTAVANKIEGISQTASTIHSTVMTNNTANATGILSQKLSYIINQLSGQSGAIGSAGRRRSTKIASKNLSAGVNTTVLELTGFGEIVKIYIAGDAATSMNLTLEIDGVAHTLTGTGAKYYGIGNGIASDKMLTALASGDGAVDPICYAKSCKLSIKNNGTSSVLCKVLHNTFDTV